MTFVEVSDSLKREWGARNKRKELADKTLYEYNVRLDLVCKTFGSKLLIEINKSEIESHINKIRSLRTGPMLQRTKRSQSSGKFSTTALRRGQSSRISRRISLS